MKITWRSELPCWLLISGMFVLGAITWPWAPDRIPVHWNLAMQVDRYGGKFEGLMLWPLIATAFYVVMLLVPLIDPGRANYATFRGAFTTLRTGAIAFLAAIDLVVHAGLRGIRTDMGTILPIIGGALLVVIGNLLGKLRPNWFVGIRTPWTLSSKTSWVRTHQVGGWMFMLDGIAFMIAGLIHRRWAAVAAFAFLFAEALTLIVYSYRVWRDDPDKMPPAGTLPA